MLTRHDVGYRVTLRRRDSENPDGQPQSELVGELIDFTDTDLSVKSSRGVVHVPHSLVVAARRMPTETRLSATGRIERIASRGWPAPDVSSLGDWVLRAADGWTARANSALTIGRPGLPLVEAVEAVEAWYRLRELPPAMMVPDPIGGRITTELRRMGWRPDPSVHLMTARLGVVSDRVRPAGGDLRPVTLDTHPSEDWLAPVARSSRGLPRAGRAVISGVHTSRFASIRDDPGEIIAIARGVIADDGQWLGLSLIEVDPGHRRAGLATRMVGALVSWAADQAATHCYLQVVSDNLAARACYDRLGFTAHHTYRTWRAP